MNAAKLLWRQFSSERWPALLLAFSVAILAALAAATPRLMSALDDRQLTETLASLSALQGDVAGSWGHTTGHSAVTGLADPWEPHREAIGAIRDAQPQPLRSLLAEPQFLGVITTTISLTPELNTGYYQARLGVFMDPDLASHAELVDGAWPLPRTDEAAPVEVATLASVAERLHWEVGDAIDATTVLSGVFLPIDESDTRWEHVPYGRNFAEEEDPNRGTAMLAGAFLAPEHLGATELATPRGPNVGEPVTVHTWFGVDVSQLAEVDVRGLRSQLTGLLTQRYPNLPPDPDSERNGVEFLLGSELGDSLTSIAAQQDTTRAVVAVAAVGPLAVGLALVVLAAQLVIERRRATFELVSARGLSSRQLRRLLTAEGLALGVSAALVGHLVGTWLTPGSQSVLAWAVALLLSGAAPLGLSWAAHRIGAVRGRSDLSLHPGRWRVVTEAVTTIATAAAIWALLSREGAPEEGLDVLATATPVLITIAACLLALRFYPVPLRMLGGWLRSGRGLPGFLGTVRAHRDPAGGLTPVFTVVLGTTIAVLSASLLGSIIAGTERAAWEANGSSLHISGPRITDDMAAELRQLDGVAAVARIHDAGSNHRLSQGSESRIRLWLAEPLLEAVYEASPFGSVLPTGLFDGRPAVVLGSQVAIDRGTARLEDVGEVQVVGELPAPPGVRTGSSWGLMSIEEWAGEVPPATLALVSLNPDADVVDVARQAAEVVSTARISTVDDLLAGVRDTPTVSGLTTTFTALTTATAVLLALTLFGSQLMATRTRTHLGAILRTLGMGRRDLRALTAWEVAPSALLGLVLGAALGVGLATLLLGALDFRSLTGGANPPPLHLDLTLLGSVLGILVVTVVLTIAVTAWLAGRANLAEELRFGEEQ